MQGIGLGDDSKVNLATRVMSSRSAAWWKRAKGMINIAIIYYTNDSPVLIIDEVSMIDAELFDKLDFVARVVRGQNKPFGGMPNIKLSRATISIVKYNYRHSANLQR